MPNAVVHSRDDQGPRSKITQKPASIFPDDDGAVLVGKPRDTVCLYFQLIVNYKCMICYLASLHQYCVRSHSTTSVDNAEAVAADITTTSFKINPKCFQKFATEF